MNVPPLTWLYVRADRPDRVEKAIASRAHAVIVDLEDGVAPDAKKIARANLGPLLRESREKPVLVRGNAGNDEELDDLLGLVVAGVVLPKVARPDDEPGVGIPAHCLIESAAGVEAAYEIARVPGVAGISLGDAGLRSETGAGETGLD